jgi:hypothetical protein
MHLEKGLNVKSLASTLFATLFVLAAANAFAADPANDIGSPWWDADHDATKPEPAPAPDPDKDKS